MGSQKSRQSHCLRTSQQSTQAGQRPHIGRKVFGVILIFLLSASLAYGAEPVGSLTPPPPPQVAPIISGVYPTDLDGNRINDALESAGAAGQISIAAANEELVEVELIFSEPITQRQIDDFLRLGGQITYIYKAISYGWNGLVLGKDIKSLPSVMGPSLVLVELICQLQPYMDSATQTGRVRPIWKPGFAGSQAGFDGDSNTTIAFFGYGVDGTHKDLSGRCAYWRDFSDDAEPSPVDYDGHDSMVAGVAMGTGDAGGANAGELRFTYAALWPDYFHMTYPIWLPSGTVTMKSTATWTGPVATLLHYSWTRGTSGDNMRVIGNYSEGKSPRTLTNTFTASSSSIVSVSLADFATSRDMDNVVITTSVSPYPGVGDGFNKFRGVAPGCKWAAVKVYTWDGYSKTSWLTAAMDDLILHRTEKNIKVVNFSHGLTFLGLPMESASMRDKVNSLVKNGIVAVAAAGNNAGASSEIFRSMADPARAAQAITVGATNDENVLTSYSNYGFASPRNTSGEDFKPDVVAPGGSIYYTAIMTVDSGSSDGIDADKEPNDYALEYGTSFAAPFVAGSAGLVIEAMEKQGVKWGFSSSDHPRFVKMLLCATASETNSKREGTDRNMNPSLNRAAEGPNAFPPGKDSHEGYGLINPDAAVEAVSQVYAAGSTVSAELGGNTSAKRVWARTINLKAQCDLDMTLDVPVEADFDLYLYGTTPSDTGTPVILKSSTLTDKGADESIRYTPTADAAALLVVKRVSGTGTFTLRSTQAGPPTALDVQANCGINSPTTITLKATDDGQPNPPGALSYTIWSKPAQGRLELTNGSPITVVPAKLPSGDKVVYRPPADWVGQDSFTFGADDGGTAPFGGQSNTATVTVTVVREITVEYSVMDSADDSFTLEWSTTQSLIDKSLPVGMHVVGMRFRNVKIPQGSAINSAKLKICAYTSGLTAEVDGVVKGEAADNPAAFGGTGRAVSALTTTSATKDWKWAEDKPWTANTWYESPDISSIVQQIVNRSGWASDNAMVIIYGVNETTFGDERRFWSYDGDPTKAPKLVITYQPK